MINQNNSEKNEIESQDIIIKKIKKKKIPKIFDKEELKEIKIIEKKGDNYPENRLKQFLFNYNKFKLPPLNSISKKNLLDNNAILIRPNILSSTKQIQYEKEKTSLNDEYLQLILQRLAPQNHNENIIIGKRKDDFNNYMEHLKILKLKEKFALRKRNIANKDEELDNTKNNFHGQKKNEEDENKKKNSKNIKRSCLLVLYEKIWNFCLKSPMDPYSKKKKIWAGKNGVFKKKFQDNRLFK
jgi:hypothetical protein